MIGTVIISNGSKIAGEAPDTIEALIAALERYPLDRFFEEHFVRTLANGEVGFHGNFRTVSHVFDVHSDDPDVIERLTSPIRRNRRMPEFLAQPFAVRQWRAIRQERRERRRAGWPQGRLERARSAAATTENPFSTHQPGLRSTRNRRALPFQETVS